MATLLSLGGNWSSASSWAVCDSTSESDSEAAATNSLGTSYSTSSTFTPGAITISGIAVKIAALAASPSGTVTVALDQATADVAGTVVTVNAADLSLGWNYFKFASPVSLSAATAYGVKAKATVTVATYIWATATTNWSRQLVTTTNPGAAPAAGDKIIVCGELTGAGTGNDKTITVDGDQSGTSIGNTSFPQSIHVSKRGTLTYSTSSAANPKLKWKGIFGVYGGGTLNCGTSGTSIPSNSTAEFVMDVASNVDTGLVFNNGSTVNIYGASKATVATLMTADKVATNTVIAVASTSGWAASDDLAFASTTRTVGDCEKKTISTVDSSTQVTLTAGLSAAHSGTSPTQAEVINLTRNIKVHGASTSLQGYVLAGATAVVNIQYAEFYWLGGNASFKQGLDLQTTTGTASVQYCSFHDCNGTSSETSITIRGTSGQTASTLVVSNNVFFDIYNNWVLVNVATSGTWTISNNIGIRTRNAAGFSLNDVGGTFTNNTAVGGSTGISANESGSFVSFSGNTAHSNSGAGVSVGAVAASTFSSTTVWRNGGTGFDAGGAGINGLVNCVIDGLVAFGNTLQNIRCLNTADVLFTNGVFSGDSTFATTNGVIASTRPQAIFENCTFGVVSGIKTAHTQDFGPTGWCQFTLRNCNLASSTEVLSFAAISGARTMYVASAKHDQTTGNHKFWLQYGVGSTDTAIYKTASPSLRLTPNNASNKLESAPPNGTGFKAAVASGGTLTVSVWTRKSSAGDSGGANYNGNQQRLIVRKNVAAGIASDTVLATAAAAVGTWEQLSGTTASVTDDATLEFIVDCDGTAGWANVDDWNASPPADRKGNQYWFDGVPSVAGDNSSGLIVVID